MNWKRNGKPIGKSLVEYLRDIITDEFALGRQIHIAVGSDSQRNGRGYKFATVILIFMKEDLGGGVIKSLGAKMIDRTYSRTIFTKGKAGVNERMLIEVEESLNVAHEIAPLLAELDVAVEIHADINPNPKWESNKSMQTAIGWILGMGYKYKIKPEAYAASFSADKHCQ